MRKAFSFYNSYDEQLRMLNDKQRLKLYDTICDVQFLRINIDDVVFTDQILKIVWAGIRHSLKTSIDGYMSKAKALGHDDVEPHSKGLGKPVDKADEPPKKPAFNFKKSLLELGVEEKVASDWLKVRRTKKAANTETAFNGIKSQIEKSGLPANECIKISAEKSWSGFNHKWLKNTNVSFNPSDTRTQPDMENFDGNF